MTTFVPDKGAPLSFKDTLNLPTTSFPIAPNFVQEEPLLLERWNRENLWHASFECNKGAEKFIIHDGPPYANGNIHLGHAYNKIIKDSIGKSQRMMGKQVPITPGWDCHGLPIEQKVRQTIPQNSSAEDIRNACKTYAQEWIDIQREQFKKLGVLMDWEHPYITMSAEYEADILQAFGRFFEGGYIEKKLKTVPWCPTDQTVLAAAEIEYQEQKDPSAYVLFPLPTETAQKISPHYADKKVYGVIWTTTPWTLALNRGILIHPSIEYALVEYQDKMLMIGASLVPALSTLLETPLTIQERFVGEILVGSSLQHPFLPRMSPIIADSSVSEQDGTALVHCAPGCGPHDYEIGIKNNLEIYSPISTDGKYTIGIEPEELVGMPVADGQFWALRTLQNNGRLLIKKNITHSYPHCWRCRNKLIFRATHQWFINLGHNNLRSKALNALSSINFFPPKSKNFLKATLEGRLEWCVSRQRVWGVPIAAVQCKGCNHSFTSPDLIAKTVAGIRTEGITFWDRTDLKDLLPPSFSCPQCKGTEFIKEHDILDVWFESGISHFAVLLNNPALSFPADLYIEGVDQHRAWFQSSLLTGMVLEGTAPMKAILTHGFTVDEKGHKMSKSLGNVVAPEDIIKQIGTDGLRLWAASIEPGADAVVTKTLLANINHVYRKIRNTGRFLLANLYDFDASKDAVSFEELLPIDFYGLLELTFFHKSVVDAYAEYDLTKVYHLLTDYCTVTLSAFYLDIIKDRLYTAAPSSRERRSAQTACYIILDALTRLMAPLMSFTAEQLSDCYQKDKKLSIHLQPFLDEQQLLKALLSKSMALSVSPQKVGVIHGIRQEFDTFVLINEHQKLQEFLQTLRSAGLKALEVLRQEGSIKHSLEASCTLYYKPSVETERSWQLLVQDLKQRGQRVEEFFKEFFIISQCRVLAVQEDTVATFMPGLFLKVGKAEGSKCARCWQWDIYSSPQGLCKRCEIIVNKI